MLIFTSNRTFFQIHKALVDAATHKAISLPNAELGSIVHSRVVPFGTGRPDADLYPLYMELSSSGPRNSKLIINLGLRFSHRIPLSLQAGDIDILLEDRLGSIPSNVSQVPGEMHGYIVSAELPDKYLGKVCS